jgi:tetratricopeptide (TPR) repeat protein
LIPGRREESGLRLRAYKIRVTRLTHPGLTLTLNPTIARMSQYTVFAQFVHGAKPRTLLRCGRAVCIAVALTAFCGHAQTAVDEINPEPPVTIEETNALETLRTYLQLQEQLHATQLAIERSRRESEKAASDRSDLLAQRLHSIEQSLNDRRAGELEAMQSSNRVMLTVAGSFAGIGFLAMALMFYFQYRSMDRLAQIASSPAMRGFALGPVGALETGEGQLMALGAAEHSSMKLLNSLERLERRISDLERGSRLSLANSASGAGESGSKGGNGHGEAAEANGKDDITGMLAEGQAYLEQEAPEKALSCFDEVLRRQNDHAEALVRKGIALERLAQLDQAVACYDRAIALDASMTIAYLHKGGVYNRMERFNEALACYEQALRTQEKRG